MTTKHIYICMLFAACAGGGPDGVATVDEAELGPMTFIAGTHCTAAEQSLLRAAQLRGVYAVMSSELDACVRYRMTSYYHPCVGYDPYAGASLQEQISRLLDASTTTNGLLLDCQDLPTGVVAETGQNDGYSFNGSEGMLIDGPLLDGKVAEWGPLAATQAFYAGVEWHEALHTHGYMHSQANIPIDCGYPESLTWLYSANGIVQECVQETVKGNRVTASDRMGHEQTLGPGSYRTSNGTLAVAATTFDVGTSLAMRTCTTDSDSSCSIVNRSSPDATPPTVLDAPPARVDVIPRVTVYSATMFGSTGHSYDYGTYGAAQLGATVGNDSIRSIWVPAGAALYACTDDLGGYGGGTCHTFYAPATDVTWLGGISFMEVLPRVTTYDAPDLYGQRAFYGIGTFTFGAPTVSSMVVPPDWLVEACTSAPGTPGSVCQTFDHSVTDLGPTLDGKVGYLLVLSSSLPRYHLGVATDGGGVVTSSPSGIACGTVCGASFLAGTNVTLSASSQTPGATAVWTGCDRLSGGNCVVNINSDRQVSVSFVAPSCDHDACIQSCEDGCDAYGSGPAYARCIQRCPTACASCN